MARTFQSFSIANMLSFGTEVVIFVAALLTKAEKCGIISRDCVVDHAVTTQSPFDSVSRAFPTHAVDQPVQYNLAK